MQCGNSAENISRGFVLSRFRDCRAVCAWLKNVVRSEINRVRYECGSTCTKSLDLLTGFNHLCYLVRVCELLTREGAFFVRSPSGVSLRASRSGNFFDARPALHTHPIHPTKGKSCALLAL